MAEYNNACLFVYEKSKSNMVYGQEEGLCVITGKHAKGLLFDKWVKPTFTDYSYLKKGNIISNEALFCFDEQSQFLMEKTGRDKPQRFRTYSHIVDSKGEWHCFTKANKKEMYEMVINGALLVCLAESGQKHILFKNKVGMWQLEDNIFCIPDITVLKKIHEYMSSLLLLGFSQTEVITGNYKAARIISCGRDKWQPIELYLSKKRNLAIFKIASFLLFNPENQ